MIATKTPLPAPCEGTRAGDQTPGLAGPATAGPGAGPASRALEAGGLEAPASGARSKRPLPTITCQCCGRTGIAAALSRPWRRTCYQRWLNAGKPVDGPPAPLPVSEVARIGGSTPRKSRAGRLEDYVELTRVRRLKPKQAAERLGVTVRTAWRYEADLRNSTPEEVTTP